MTLAATNLRPHKLHLQVGALLALAVFVWLRDLTWVATAADTIPVLAALPVLFWLGMPWDKREPQWDAREWRIIWGASVCFIVGIVANWTLLFAVSWALAFWAIAHAGVYPNPRRNLVRLLPLAVLAFPWLSLDFQFVGFWFRVSGAMVAELFLQSLGVAVQRLGTCVTVAGVELDVSEACGGLHGLQAMLIGGFALAYIQLGRSKWFWLSLPILVSAAWLANTLRVVLTAYIVVWGESEWATGHYHQWQGLAVNVIVFLACSAAFACLGKPLLGEPPLGEASEGGLPVCPLVRDATEAPTEACHE